MPMDTMKVDVPAEVKERFDAMLARFSRENDVTLVVRPDLPAEEQPRH